MFLPPKAKDNSRGVVIYLKEGISRNLVDMDEGNFEESVWLQITSNGLNLLFGCIYRSPSGDSNNNAKLNGLLSKAGSRNYSHLIVVGDFNYRGIDWRVDTTTGGTNSDEQSFLDAVNDLFLHQHVNEPTRQRTGQRPSLLDLVLTNDEDTVSDVNIGPPIGKSDHMTVTFEMDVDAADTEEPLSRSYYHADYDTIRYINHKDIDWNAEFENTSGVQAMGNILECSTQEY